MKLKSSFKSQPAKNKENEKKKKKQWKLIQMITQKKQEILHQKPK